jgi:phosphotransferase system, enzyme I, PtsP
VSMAPASIGPVKTMILSVDAAKTERFLDECLKMGDMSVRAALSRFAQDNDVEV